MIKSLKNEERLHYVYAHINKINGKIYIGQTKKNPPHARWNSTGSGYIRNQHFWRAIQKYGWDNFEHEIIASGLTQEEADKFEYLLITKLDTTNPERGYNQEARIQGHRLYSEDLRKRMSESKMGEKNPMYGKTQVIYKKK